MVGYQLQHDGIIAGKSKRELANVIKSLHGSGDFYSEHAMILLCDGSDERLKRMRVTDWQDSVMAGSGAWRIPDLLLQADVGFVLDATLTACDYQLQVSSKKEDFNGFHGRIV